MFFQATGLRLGRTSVLTGREGREQIEQTGRCWQPQTRLSGLGLCQSNRGLQLSSPTAPLSFPLPGEFTRTTAIGAEQKKMFFSSFLQAPGYLQDWGFRGCGRFLVSHHYVLRGGHVRSVPGTWVPGAEMSFSNSSLS